MGRPQRSESIEQSRQPFTRDKPSRKDNHGCMLRDFPSLSQQFFFFVLRRPELLGVGFASKHYQATAFESQAFHFSFHRGIQDDYPIRVPLHHTKHTATTGERMELLSVSSLAN